MKKIFLSLLILGLFGLAPAATAFESTYYVVRHAEKQGGDDPLLTAKGLRRAAHIAAMLKDVTLDQIYSTDTNRTIMTATPTAANKGIAIEMFSTDDLESFAAMLKTKEGIFLIVAHSGSAPETASYLSGIQIPELDETDYEKLFKVVITDGKPTLVLMETTFE